MNNIDNKSMWNLALRLEKKLQTSNLSSVEKKQVENTIKILKLNCLYDVVPDLSHDYL